MCPVLLRIENTRARSGRPDDAVAARHQALPLLSEAQDLLRRADLAEADVHAEAQ